MEDTIGRLKDARLRLDKIVEELPGLDATKIGTMALRAQEILDSLLKGRDTTQEVLNEYTRLLREMELNRVMPKLVTKVQGEIVFPLEGALRTEFVQAEEAGEQYRKELAAGQKPSADPLKLALDRLIDRLNKVMDAMGEIKGINDLITALRAIEKAQEQDIGGVLRRIKKEKEDELFRRIGALQ
jgi:urease gamma subunit